MFEVIEKARDQIAQRNTILALQEAMRPHEQYQEQLVHHHCDGLYGREMRIEAGVLLVGKTHKKPCLNFILQGEAEVLAAEGAFIVKAPEVFVSPAGTKRAMRALTDLIWVTVHPTDQTDLERIEDDLIDDHAEFLGEYGFSQRMAREVSETPFVHCDGPFSVEDSPIHGQGIFATLEAGESLPAAIGGQKTIVGRYTNHSAFPNARVVKRGNGDIEFVALEHIDGEVTVNYREVLS